MLNCAVESLLLTCKRQPISNRVRRTDCSNHLWTLASAVIQVAQMQWRTTILCSARAVTHNIVRESVRLLSGRRIRWFAHTTRHSGIIDLSSAHQGLADGAGGDLCYSQYAIVGAIACIVGTLFFPIIFACCSCGGAVLLMIG